jgi:hypothetical protein
MAVWRIENRSWRGPDDVAILFMLRIDFVRSGRGLLRLQWLEFDAEWREGGCAES